MNHEGFLEKILEEPDDDVHRLVYSDWLEENGFTARAEIIRLEDTIETDGSGQLLKTRLTVPQYGEVLAIVAECAPSRRFVPERLVFRKGFIEEVHAPLDVLLEYLPWMAHKQPVKRVVVTDRSAEAYTEDGSNTTDDALATIFTWWRCVYNSQIGEEPVDPNDLPMRVWRELDGFFEAAVYSKDYYTRQDADAALSRALLTLARRTKVDDV
jgi:uncharacterized protein (TIGR02996 family)